MNNFLKSFKDFGIPKNDIESEKRYEMGRAFSYTNVGSRSGWAEIEVVDHYPQESFEDNTSYGKIPRGVIVKVLDSHGFNAIPRDGMAIMNCERSIFKHQTPFDRHVMTTIGARFIIEANCNNKLGIPRFSLKELNYGMEHWDKDFRW